MRLEILVLQTEPQTNSPVVLAGPKAWLTQLHQTAWDYETPVITHRKVSIKSDGTMSVDFSFRKVVGGGMGQAEARLTCAR